MIGVENFHVGRVYTHCRSVWKIPRENLACEGRWSSHRQAVGMRVAKGGANSESTESQTVGQRNYEIFCCDAG
jgi:hypothetical protein